MVTVSDQHPRNKKNICGGNGLIELKHLATQEQMYGHCRVFAHVTIQPGNSIGDHPHDGDTEFYYILKGHPTFNDTGTMVTLHPGDCGATGYGETHGLINNTDEVVELIALIPMDQ